MITTTIIKKKGGNDDLCVYKCVCLVFTTSLGERMDHLRMYGRCMKDSKATI